MNKKLKQNIKQYIVERINNVEGYDEYEYKLVKTHPQFNQTEWDEWSDGDNTKYDTTAQKMIRWANKQIVSELFS